MTENTPIYKNPSSPINARIQDLLSRMTLQEKVGQMTQIERSVLTPAALTHYCVGSVTGAPGSIPFENALTADWADMVDGIQNIALESRFGIPIIYGIDAVHGNSCVFGATIFPHNVALGATMDDDLVRRIGAATALEVRASGIHYVFAPCVAVTRDRRWGRCYESFSEDPDIVKKMTSVVTGLQGEPPQGHPFVAGSNNVIACAKHFVGDGGTEKGLNEGNTIATYEELEKIHMAPYINCISQGVSTIMASYTSWNGERMHSHRYLLTDILKEKLGFKGFIISDWEGIDTISTPYGSNYHSCVLSAINAGIDMVMVPLRYEQFINDLIYLVESGEVPMSRIDDAVERILRVKFTAGIFEHIMSDTSLIDTVGCKLHRDLGCEAVRKSLVLLKNGKDLEKPLLPLDKSPKRILVAGSHANNLGYQCGGWTITKYGQGGQTTIGTTILEAIEKSVGDEVEVIYEENPSAEFLSSQEFSYAIVVIGEGPYAESTGYSLELTIPFNGTDIVCDVADKTPTLTILISGRPVVLEPRLLEKTDGLIAAWLPGSEGGGVADVLFGDYEFVGRLPVTWFKHVRQVPLNFGQEPYDPLFPIGFGLTCAM